MKRDVKKVFIIGISGAGKSALAEKVSGIIDAPHFDLDDIFWKQRGVRRDKKECASILKDLISKNGSWVIEGVHDFGKVAVEKADLVIFLNYGINIPSWRVFKRWFGRKDESLKDIRGLIWYIRNYKRVRSGKSISDFENHKRIISNNKENLVEANNRWQLNRLLDMLSNYRNH